MVKLAPAVLPKNNTGEVSAYYLLGQIKKPACAGWVV
jgi:hypothetical protein